MSGRRGSGYDDDDRLPWLETVDDDYSEGTSLGRILLLILVVAALVSAGLFGWYWWQRQPSLISRGTGELIEAPPGPYKVKPDQPGGMEVEGEGDTAFSTSEGTLINGTLDLDRAPEDPVVGPPVQAPKVAAAAPAVKVVTNVPVSAGKLEVPAPKPKPKPPAPKPAAGGATVQLGSFPSEAGANTAWTRLTKRFKYLEPLGKSVMKAEVDGKTMYRLRVNAGTNAAARDVCGRLKLAGEGCYLAN